MTSAGVYICDSQCGSGDTTCQPHLTPGATQPTDTDDRLDHGESGFDEMRLGAVEPYEVVWNPVLGHQYRFLRRDTNETVEFLQSEFQFDADANHFDAHVHLEQVERIRVISGSFAVVVGDDRRTLGPGEEITLSAGVPHYHGNVAGVETRALHEIRPPIDFEEGLRMFCELTAADKTNARGQNLLATAVFLDPHPPTAVHSDTVDRRPERPDHGARADR